MTDREKLARQWAESRQQFDNRSERERAAADYILDNIEPQTPPTMEGVKWDDEKHVGLGVQAPNGDNRVLILNDTPSLWLTALPDFTEILLFPRDSLTPNGKRYELREVGKGEPDHPKLTPVYDYEVQFGQDWSPQGYEYESLEAVKDLLNVRNRRNPARIITRQVTDWEVVE